MLTTKFGILIFTTVMATALGISGVYSGLGLRAAYQPAFAQETFVASNMTGVNEVPPVNTTASGEATFVNNQTFIGFDLAVSDLFNATAAHIHRGQAGTNGPIVVTLYNTTDPSPGLFGGYSGNITASTLQGPLANQDLTALVDLMKSGQAYANIHTIQNKNGEIRDQIAPSADNATEVT
jgi:CHRD domain